MQLTTTNRQGFAPATITEAMEFSKMLAGSTMVPKAYQGKPQDIMVCVQWGMELGLAPMQALQNIAVINGKPSVYGDAALALVQASSLCEGIDEYIENEGTPNPVAVCVAKRKGRNPVISRFSVEDAKRAGLWGKGGPWQSYPKRMLAMRARGFALRDAFPDVLKGLITAEEAQDYPDDINHGKPAKVAISQANPLDALPPAKLAPASSLPAQTSDPMVIEAAMADTLDEPPPLTLEEIEKLAEQGDLEVVHIEEIGEPPEAPVPMLFALLVPGKQEPTSVHDTLEEWQEAYEDLADKVARAGKASPRDRMTKLRELREVNEPTLAKVDMVKRIRHTANYSKRLNALGAAQ
jgi:hypothetical protein